MIWLPTALTGALSILAATDALPPIQAAGWIYAGASATTVMLVKPEPAPAGSPWPRMLVRFEEAVPFDRDGFASMSNLELNDIDCAGARTRLVRDQRFSQRNLSGEVHLAPVEVPVWRTESKGSFGAAILSAACGEAEDGAV
jgi:hypothetical protein